MLSLRVVVHCVVTMSWLLLVHARGAHAQSEAQPGVAPPEHDAKQDEPQRTSDVVFSHFETSYLAYPIRLGGLAPLLLESSIVPHFVVHRPSWPFAFVLTPKIVVRMFNAQSTPVMTPSYMPRVSLYGWLTDPIEPHTLALYGSVAISHHSNGQAGQVLTPGGAINHDSGSFSTNYIETALYLVRARERFFGWNQLALVWHPGIGFDPGMRGLYPRFHVRLASALLETRSVIVSRLTVELGAALDKMLLVSNSRVGRVLERCPLSVQYSVSLPGFDLGLYAAYYLGHDYYNIWFDHWVHAIQIGISGRVGAANDLS